MLKRIYIDNFRCFVNFELHLEKVSLLLGANGSGKTSIFNILERIQRLVSDGEKISDLFKNESLTRWRTDSLLQKIELDVSGNDGTYRYSLEVEHSSNRQVTRIRNESLFFNTQQLYCFRIETDETGATVSTAHLYNDNPEHPGIVLPFDWTRSGLYISFRRDMTIRNSHGSETGWNTSLSPALIRMSCMRKPVSPGRARHGTCQIMRTGLIILPMNTAGK